jgi:hypothetical protein
MKEICYRWRAQTRGWENDQAMLAAWARTLIATQSTAAELKRGLDARSHIIYPPDLPAIISSGRVQAVSEEATRRSYLAAVRASSSGEYWRLSDEEWAAGCAWGWSEVRTSPGEAWKKWADLLEKAGRGELAATSQKPRAVPLLGTKINVDNKVFVERLKNLRFILKGSRQTPRN